MQLRRLFVSAVLSLICILISPVLSTDALWNVISANTVSNPDTTIASYVINPSCHEMTDHKLYIYQLWLAQSAALPNQESFVMFKPTNLPNGNHKIGTAKGTSITDVHSVVLTEAKTMYAGGGGTTNTYLMQIHTMNYDTGSGLYSQTSWVTNAGFTFAVTKLVYEAGTTSYLYYLQSQGGPKLNRLDITTPLTATNDINAGAPRYLLSSPTVTTNIVHGLQLRLGKLMVWGRTSANMQFVDKTTMALTTTLTGSVTGEFFSLDNLNSQLVFAVNWISASPYGLYRIPIPASGTT